MTFEQIIVLCILAHAIGSMLWFVIALTHFDDLDIGPYVMNILLWPITIPVYLLTKKSVGHRILAFVKHNA